MKNILGELTRFGSIGALGTLLGTTLIFLFYNFFGLGYWGSSATAYLLASLLSYKLNKELTFKAQGSWRKLLPKFSLNIALCYGLAYSLARPLVKEFLQSQYFSSEIQDQVALLFGIVTYTGLNFLGQKFWVFRTSHS